VRNDNCHALVRGRIVGCRRAFQSRVIPAQAGIQGRNGSTRHTFHPWTPACAGVTDKRGRQSGRVRVRAGVGVSRCAGEGVRRFAGVGVRRGTRHLTPDTCPLTTDP